jgi:hypothetical protein
MGPARGAGAGRVGRVGWGVGGRAKGWDSTTPPYRGVAGPANFTSQPEDLSVGRKVLPGFQKNFCF